jgi:Glycosyltransferase family 92
MLWSAAVVILLLPFASSATNIGTCLMFRGEPLLLIEWIEWHYLVGVTHFYLYEDAASNDTELQATQEVLGFYQHDDRFHVRWQIQEDVQSRYPIEEEHAQQKDAYANCMRDRDSDVDWLLFIDNDEFGVPHKRYASLTEFVDSLEPSVDAVLLFWKQFGAAGGFQSYREPSRDHSLPMITELRYPLADEPFAFRMMARATDDVLAGCRWFNGGELPCNCFAHSSLASAMAVRGDTLELTDGECVASDVDRSGEHVSLHRFPTRSCYEYFTHARALRTDLIHRATPYKDSVKRDDWPTWLRISVHPELCVLGARKRSSPAPDVEHSSRYFRDLIDSCRRHSMWPNRVEKEQQENL